MQRQAPVPWTMTINGMAKRGGAGDDVRDDHWTIPRHVANSIATVGCFDSTVISGARERFRDQERNI